MGCYLHTPYTKQQWTQPPWLHSGWHMQQLVTTKDTYMAFRIGHSKYLAMQSCIIPVRETHKGNGSITCADETRHMHLSQNHPILFDVTL
jgi:hypothetical protein